MHGVLACVCAFFRLPAFLMGEMEAKLTAVGFRSAFKIVHPNKDHLVCSELLDLFRCQS